MTVEYSLRTGGMSQLVDVLRSAEGKIRAELVALDLEAARLRTGWTGEASAAYERAYAEWSRSLAELRRILDSAAGASERAVDNHMKARMEVTSLWG
jgi:WXG100 family type VII secretion target